MSAKKDRKDVNYRTLESLRCGFEKYKAWKNILNK